MTVNNQPPAPHSGCQCRALSEYPCRNAISQEDLLCDTCRNGRGMCMVILLGDPPEALWGHTEPMRGARFDWRGPS